MDAAELGRELDSRLDAGVARGAAPGVSAIVVDRSGVVYEGAFGERSIGTGIEMRLDTVAAIFSMTKAITGAAVMQLVERGELDLDAPACDVCPVIGEAQVLEGFDGDGNPVTRPPASPVTLRHLMTHTSGHVYGAWNENSKPWRDATGAPTQGKASLATPLAFDPGTRWEYGIGIDWAGQMVEAVSGLTLGEYFAANLTGPLGMADTAFAHTPQMLDRAAGIHARLPDGSFGLLDMSGRPPCDFDEGGAGLHGTVGDYGRFIRMILNDGELDGTRVLAAETVAMMATNQIGELRVQPLMTVMPAQSNDAEFFPGDPKSWGLSFQINEVAGFTGRPAGTLMWAGLANCYFWIDRKNGIGGAYLSQVLPFADLGSLGLFYEMESAVYQHVR